MSRKKPAVPVDPPEPADEHDRKLLADVERHGWHVLAVEEDDEGPAFAYSVGLFRSFGHPEVIVFGLAVPVLHRIVNAVGEVVRSAKKFEHLDESGDVLDGYNVAFRTVERKRYADFLGYACWFYRNEDFPALQCVWPDSRHWYPWHPASDPTLARRQPLMGTDTSWPFHEGKNRAVFTTRPVLEDAHPILLVTHDRDGDWQFLCGTTNEPEEGRIVSLGCVLERDCSLARVADLPEGWRAYRTTTRAAWRREQTAER